MLSWYPQLLAAAGAFDGAARSAGSASATDAHGGTAGRGGWLRRRAASTPGAHVRRDAAGCDHPIIVTDAIGDVQCACCEEDLTD